MNKKNFKKLLTTTLAFTFALSFIFSTTVFAEEIAPITPGMSSEDIAAMIQRRNIIEFDSSDLPYGSEDSALAHMTSEEIINASTTMTEDEFLKLLNEPLIKSQAEQKAQEPYSAGYRDTRVGTTVDGNEFIPILNYGLNKIEQLKTLIINGNDNRYNYEATADSIDNYDYTVELTPVSKKIMTMDDNMNVHVFADGNGVIIFNLTSKTDKARKRTIYIGIKAYYEGTDTVPTDNKDKNLYTVYNPNTEEYIFSTNPGEINYLISLGWINQGSRGWTIDGTESVYRLYNPNSGAHHYTKDYNEYSYLTSIGWNGEGEVFKSGGTFPTYRLYDAEQARRGNEPGTHKYTQNYEHLMKMIGFAGGPKGQYEYTYIGENCLRGELLPYPALSNEGIAWYTTPNLDFTDWDLW